ncbi:MAG: hypothetical protein FXF47_04455 [Candidatus Mcinerneyibacterium aminivorans]|uniref:DUF4296 domain-containing protein n=1 Tax=Candidatus Mcinerneyibacterium aminivorans TaxID=2703815 RepID=A0A5D0MHN0_9BACT|nr:MAG: hypothetical protein FXF47_04455 [Candidatus Mcinerneyibacterium aminivorans]
MKDRKFLIIIPAIIIIFLLTALKFKKNNESTVKLTQKEKFILIYKRLQNYENGKSQKYQHITEYEIYLRDKYQINKKEWNNFLSKLNNDKNYLKNYLDLLKSR